jgi:hypothetical protein
MNILENFTYSKENTHFSSSFGISDKRFDELIDIYETARNTVVDRYVTEPEYLAAEGIEPYGEIGREIDKNITQPFTESEAMFIRHFMLSQREQVVRVIVDKRLKAERHNPEANYQKVLEKLLNSK